MSALYSIRYLGVSGLGVGAIYIGRGAIVGVDVGDGRYKGTYVEGNGQLTANLTLSLPAGGELVTGMKVPPGTTIPITALLPLNFANGSPQQISVAGKSVQVIFEKIGEVP